jgi:hypothetical protein
MQISLTAYKVSCAERDSDTGMDPADKGVILGSMREEK